MQRKDACSRVPLSSGTGLNYPPVHFSSLFPENGKLSVGRSLWKGLCVSPRALVQLCLFLFGT